MFLSKIVATKQEELKQLKQTMTLAQAEREVAHLPACLGFEQALTAQRKRNIGLIAEVKKASPSKGLIRADFDPVSLAQSYERAGADCLSVLTDKEYFQGNNDYLQQVRQMVSLPILRKDFTLDVLQVYEARLIGADAVLLIAAILSDGQLLELYDAAKGLGMDVLVEVHDQEELERVLQTEATLIGINNRNLKTFETSLQTTEQLISHIPQGKTIVSESGLGEVAHIEYVRNLGADAVLIGEHFMRQPEIEQAVTDLLGPLPEKEGQA